MMRETYSSVIWLSRDGTLVCREEGDVEREYVTPPQRDVSYGEEGRGILRLPDHEASYREDKAQAKQAGYLVWGEGGSRGLRFTTPYAGLANALQTLARTLGVEVPLPAVVAGER